MLFFLLLLVYKKNMKKIYIALIYITLNQLSFSQIQTKSPSKFGYDIHVSNQQPNEPNRSRIQLKTIILDENFENVSNNRCKW